MPKTLAQWLDHLETLHPVDIELGLDRVSKVAERMGLLQRPIAKRVISVAGTNGKGSTLAIIDSVARAHGQRVGTYMSPHLLRYNERVQLDGYMVSDDQLVAGFEAVEQARLAAPSVSLTYFEAGTLCALWCLVQQPLDLAVLEVGLGGRLDAVNIVDADVAIVTTIAQDHAGFLGTDIAQIGREKAGIFRSQRPAVLGSRDLPESVAACADALSSPVYQLGRNFEHTSDPASASWRWQGHTAAGDMLTLDALPDPGLPIDNAATALQALVLSGYVLAASPTQTALTDLVVPGRMQWRGQWCLDVGHNPHAADYLARHLPPVASGATQWGVIGMLIDKDADGVIKALSSRINDWVCVSLEGERGRQATDLAERIAAQGGRVHHCAASPIEGVEWLANQLGPDDRVLATGSFFTVAALSAQPLPQA
ncbi:MAG: bifunctional tetrahydrofolate synthase/dihydrofolate synthase [Halomonas sp.]|nr:bifunctional tetrahydrofolate synthase/dihydrofolate synthase [Halomonas sp.]